MYTAYYWCKALGGPIQWYFKNKPSIDHLQQRCTEYFDGVVAGDNRITHIEQEVRDAIDSKEFQIVGVPLTEN